MILKISSGSVDLWCSGQSGSGKTEATKLIVHYLSFSYEGRYDHLRQVFTEWNTLSNVWGFKWWDGTHLSLQSFGSFQPMEVFSIMESFGNAKTILNNNSSRFGKYLHIHILQ